MITFTSTQFLLTSRIEHTSLFEKEKTKESHITCSVGNMFLGCQVGRYMILQVLFLIYQCENASVCLIMIGTIGSIGATVLTPGEVMLSLAFLFLINMVWQGHYVVQWLRWFMFNLQFVWFLGLEYFSVSDHNSLPTCSQLCCLNNTDTMKAYAWRKIQYNM